MRATKVRRQLPVELLIADVGRRMTARAQAVVGDVGLSEGAWWVLYELARACRGLSLVEVAHRTSLSPSTVTAVTDHLAGRGWIDRARAVGDRRRVVVVITAAGTHALEAGLARCEQEFAAQRDRLTAAEWQTLGAILVQLLNSYNEAVTLTADGRQ